MNDTQALISHQTTEQWNLITHQNKLRAKSKRILSLEEELLLLEQLSQFELGRFLLENKGLNGYWTAYVILHGPKKKDLNPLEEWLLHHSPAIKATQERFQIFQKQLQNYIKPKMVVASIPCGLMDDLFLLSGPNTLSIERIGIDLDEQSLKLAQENNAQNFQHTNVSYLKRNAWNLEVDEKFDMITSNGLNIYEPDDQKVVALYRELFKALKPGGLLIGSFLTPPPALSTDSTWVDVDSESITKQIAIFNDILEVNWQIFRTEDQTSRQLEEAGFTLVDIIYDTKRIFPTFVAKK